MNLIEEALKKVIEYLVLVGFTYMFAMLTRVSKKDFEAHVKKEEEYKERVIGGLQKELQEFRSKMTDQSNAMGIVMAELKSGQAALEKRMEQGFQMLERMLRNEHN